MTNAISRCFYVFFLFVKVSFYGICNPSSSNDMHARIPQNQIKENECCQIDKKGMKKMDRNQVLGSALIEEMSAILSAHFKQDVRLISFRQLSEDKRRNRIMRIGMQSCNRNVPKTLIFKQTLQKNSSEKDLDSLRRFSRDWAGLEFLEKQKFASAPRFYGGSLKNRFILLEDLGGEHISLVDALTGDDPKIAEAALHRFMKRLGQFHVAGYGKTEDYLKIFHKLNPISEDGPTNFQRSFDKTLPKLQAMLKALNIPESGGLWEEIKDVFKANTEPGPFTTLIHGDICPDNVFDYPQENNMRIIDFEHATLRSALLDGTYLRMSMPTCWCAKAFPSKLIPSLEDAYRKELMRKIPAAKDDKLYITAYVHACAFWMIKSALLIKDVLEKEDIWGSGPTPKNSLWNPKKNLVRPRIISRLEAFIEVSKQHNLLPHLRGMAEQILAELKSRWVDVKPLDLYPAFVTVEKSQDKR